MTPKTTPSTSVLIRWLTSITRPVHAPLAFSALMRIVGLILEIVLFGLVTGGVAALVDGRGRVGVLLGAVVAAALCKAVAGYLEQFSGHYVAFKALELLRTHAFASLWPKAPGIVSSSRSGDLFASLTRDIDRVEVFYAHTFAPALAAYVVPALALVGAGAATSWQLVSVPAVCVVLSLTLVPFARARRAMAATARQIEARRDLAAHVTDSVYGADEVLGYGLFETRAAEMGDLERRVAAATGRARAIAAARRGAMVLLTGVSLVWVAALGAGSTVATCAVMGGVLRLFVGPRGVEDAVGYLDHSFAAARRLYELDHAPARVIDGPRTLALDHAPEVSWEGVDYAYDTAGGFDLRGVDIRVPAGRHALFVGHSGSGKTTATRLLARYDNPDAGCVRIEGCRVEEYTLDSLHRHVVTVAQAPDLPLGTIAQSLRLGAPHASEEELWDALETAALADEVRAMPAGLNTQVGVNGANLSGGQAQRLCLARALVRHPRVLILDEYGASLNPELEAQIRAALARLRGEVTIIEIAHPDAGGIAADIVYEFDNGRVHRREHDGAPQAG